MLSGLHRRLAGRAKLPLTEKSLSIVLGTIPKTPSQLFRIQVLEKGFVVFALWLFTQALLLLLHEGGGPVGHLSLDQDFVTWLVFSGVYIITCLLIVLRWKHFIRTVTKDKFLLLLVGLAPVSVLWSIAPELTLRRSVALVGTTLFGAYLASRYDLDELLRLLAWALGIAGLLSLVFALALPWYGIYIDTRGEAWRGIYWHKNHLGRAMALSGIVFLFLAFSSRRYRWVAWVGLGLSSALLLLSKSVAALVSLPAALALGLLYGRALRWNYALAISLFFISMATPFFIITILISRTTDSWFAANALSALGRNITLSGRTELWAVLLNMIWQHPWLGYGYGAFWQSGAGEYVRLWILGLGTDVALPQVADNGYLDLWLALGLLGVSVFAFQLLLAFLRTATLARFTDNLEGLWPFTYLTYIVVYSFSESTILAYNNLYWVLYVVASLSPAVRSARIDKGSHKTIEQEQTVATEAPNSIEQEMSEIRSRMAPDLSDLRDHIQPQAIKEQVKQSLRERLRGILNWAKPTSRRR
jgi:exopolysaccharide production protein ExoQ